MSGVKGMKKSSQSMREKLISEYDSSKSQCELSKEYGINRYAIHCWSGAISKKSILPKHRGHKSAKTLQEYKYENKRLKMENK